jgi:hypothetical protein
LKQLLQIVLVGLLTTFPAVAQVTAVDEQPEERRYTVEMIIFAYTRDVATAGEIFVPDPVIDPEFFDGTTSGGMVDAPDQTARPLPTLEFEPLDPGDFAMGDVMGHLRRIDIYRPLMHFGWTQSTRPEELTRPIQLASLARPAPGLGGSLKLYLSRFLHLVVDLEMQADGSDETGVVVGNRPVYYRIREDRIFRSGELRYFDHPKFGVIARITRVAEDAPAESTELLGYPTQ